MPRRLRHLPGPSLVELTALTIHSRHLIHPSLDFRRSSTAAAPSSSFDLWKSSPTAAKEILAGEPLRGAWFNRTAEWAARRQGEDFEEYDYATRYEIELSLCPAGEVSIPLPIAKG